MKRSYDEDAYNDILIKDDENFKCDKNALNSRKN